MMMRIRNILGMGWRVITHINAIFIEYWASEVGLKGCLELSIAGNPVEGWEFVGEQRFGKKAQFSNSAFAKVSAFFEVASLDVNLNLRLLTTPLSADDRRSCS